MKELRLEDKLLSGMLCRTNSHMNYLSLPMIGKVYTLEEAVY